MRDRPLAETVESMELRARVESFLHREAYLADERQYRDWLSMWAAEGELLYWCPPRVDADPSKEVCLVYDDRSRLQQRVARWESGFAWSQDPPSLTRRIVGNLEVEATDDGAQAVGNAIIHISRRTTDWVLSARLRYRLVRDREGRFSISEKCVVLIDPETPLGNVTFVL